MAKLGYHSAIIDAVSGGGKAATISVYDTGTSDLATIYADIDGGSKGNPFVTDSLGRFSFFVNSGIFDIEVSGVGVVTYKLEGVSLIDMSIPPSGGSEIKNIYIDPETGKCEVEY